ncbi:MAG TPA: NADPH:quinone reductase [Gemmatimonadales bacterium]|nr:NADPH:quinone reductase [Gemmatimonadales bacterium]
MRAIVVHRFGGPEVLSLEEAPDPVAGPGQVVIRNHAAGVNPVDAYTRSGTYARLPPLPYTPGWDGAGVVERVGSEVKRLAPGTRVYFSGTVGGRGVGGYAERVCCNENQVHLLADRLTFAQGAAIGVPYATAHRALFQRGATRPGETVLVHGASGAVGLAAVQLARAHGCLVIGTAGSEEGLELVQRQGASHAVRHGTDQTATQVLAATKGRGVDVIVEMLANANLDRDLSLLAVGGRVLIVGNRGRVEIDPRQTMAKESAVLGVMLWHATDDELAQVHQELAGGFADGSLTPVVWQELPLDQAARAQELVFEGGAKGKVVLSIDD